MPIQNFLSRLQKVQSRGKRGWMACCPAHPDKSPSMSVKEGDDGRVLAYCFGGCSIEDIVAAVGLEMEDLFPASDRPRRRPLLGPNGERVDFQQERAVIMVWSSTNRRGEATSADNKRYETAIARLAAIGRLQSVMAEVCQFH